MVIKELESRLCVQSYIKDGKIVNLNTIRPEAYNFYNRLYWNRPDIFEIIPEVKHYF